MRCSCAVCDTWMVHSEGMKLGCVCPQCGYRCQACLGTDTVLSPSQLRDLRQDPLFLRKLADDLTDPAEEELPPAEEDPWLD
ncbi:MAG: hypothetical protein IKE30_00110 [Clostridia bacterium]|nr:hypothetical protein [Clostridia bacterium]